MKGASRSCALPSGVPYYGTGHRRSVLSVLLAMVSAKIKEYRSSTQRSAEEVARALRQYLDGYFLSFDYYPVCTHHIFARNDAFALWSDFLKVAEDLSSSAAKIIESPEEYMALGHLTGDELKQRKQQAASQSLGEILDRESKRRRQANRQSEPPTSRNPE